MDARVALFDAGIGRALVERVVGLAAESLRDKEPAVVVELGCGSGHTLGRLGTTCDVVGVGIDLSAAAAASAARRYPNLTWVVANVDRRVPMIDHSVDLILSVHARRNASECHRVLRPGGRLLVAVPAADDLVELRTAVQGAEMRRDRLELLVAAHNDRFAVVDRATVREQLTLERAVLLKLLQATYRGERFSESPAVRTLDRLEVTLASDVVLFAPR